MRKPHTAKSAIIKSPRDDNIFSNVFPLPESRIILSDISDHYPISMHVPIKCSKKGHYFRRKITDDNLRRLQQGLIEVDWSYIYETEDINLGFDYFMDVINSKLNEYIPLHKYTNDYKKIHDSHGYLNLS